MKINRFLCLIFLDVYIVYTLLLSVEAFCYQIIQKGTTAGKASRGTPVQSFRDYLGAKRT